MARPKVFDDLLVDHIEFYVDSLTDSVNALCEGYGFTVYATSGGTARAQTRSAALGLGQIRLVLIEPLVGDHPGTAFLEKHGDGVADISLRVADAAAAFDLSIQRGARPVSGPAGAGGLVRASIMGFGDVTHTFVERSPGADERWLPGLVPAAAAATGWDSGLMSVDHFAVCLEAGQLEPTVEFYRQVLDFDLLFAERIQVGQQAMDSKVVRSSSGAVTLTLLEPDVSRTAGQIDEFLKSHAGAGVQHVAFATTDIVSSVTAMRAMGVEFLHTPASYYHLLGQRLTPARHAVRHLRELGILVDEDHEGQLFQIFARSTHPRNTFFFEVIERMGAKTFGSGNIRALYEAVELQRQQEQRGS